MTDFHLLRDKLKNLPVYEVIGPVVRDVVTGKVTVVAASTGSGKSMMLPGALADVSEHQIVVCVPRRFLAFDSAFNVADLAEIEVGDKVGYAVGQIGGEKSLHSDKTRLLYCTYGYALSSGLINTARTIVLDEVHEADEYISLARAILRERKLADPCLSILEMSATINAEAQASYWRNIAETAVYAVEGRALDSDLIDEKTMSPRDKSRSVEELAVSLLTKGRKGSIIFRPGVREVENTVAETQKQLGALKFLDVEVVGVHGGSSYDERATARRAPEPGKRKIVVGTNVLESGVNLLWVDSAISDGTCKIPYHRYISGAEALVLEDLTQARLLQQIGRINRSPAATGFDRGLFFLHAQKEFDVRRAQNGPAIERQSLNDVAFYAASLGYNPTKLVWDITDEMNPETLNKRFEQAKQELIRLQLVRDDWSLTEQGEFVKHLPVSPETGAMLWEARKLDERRLREKKPPRVMRDAVILAAISESHGLRKKTASENKGAPIYESDLLDDMNAFLALRTKPLVQKVLDATEEVLAKATPDDLLLMQKQREKLNAECLGQNISYNSFMEAARLAEEIATRLVEHHASIRIAPRSEEDIYDAKRYAELQRCIMNANVNRLFLYENKNLRDLLRDFGTHRKKTEKSSEGYMISKGSVVTPQEGTLMVGGLREVHSKNINLPVQTVLTEVTAIPADVFIAWAEGRAANGQPILSDSTYAKGKLKATYAGKTRFEIRASQAGRAYINAPSSTIYMPPRGKVLGKSRYPQAML
jgi:HrpA-like RNA helicase